MKWLVTFFFILISCTSVLAAQIEPASLSYQGTLADSGGQPLTGSHQLQVCLYNEPSSAPGLPAAGGTAFWCDVYDVILQEGRFSIVLGGNDNPLSGLTDQFNGTSYVGLKVGTDPEMPTRQKLTSVPYAFKAKEAISAYNGVPVGTIIAWHKSMSGTPALPEQWAECDGSVIGDPESPYNGQTIPNLNGQYNSWNSKGSFLRGNTSSGEFENDTFQGHGHDIAFTGTDYEFRREQTTGANVDVETSGAPPDDQTYRLSDFASQLYAGEPQDGSHGSVLNRVGTETRPVNMSVVWIIKIK